MAYIVYQDVEKFLNITLTADGQALVNELINAVDKLCDNLTNRQWNVTADQTEKFDGGTDTFFPKLPVSSVVSVKIDGDTYDLNDVYNYKQYIKLETEAASGNQNVEITYTPDASMPDDLKHALVRWVSEVFKAQEDAGRVVGRFSAGPVTIEYLTQDGIPKYVEDAFRRYRVITGG